MKTYKPAISAIMDDSGMVDVLKLTGELAWDTAPAMEKTIEKFAGRPDVPLAIDLSGLEFIDSKGVSFLLRMRFAFEDKAVSLVSIPPNIKKVLERTFVMNRFRVCRNVAEIEEGLLALLEPV